MEDYAGAWHAQRDRCHRFVYDEHGKPTVCAEPPIQVGWRYAAYTRRWHTVDACERHAKQLTRRPVAPSRRAREV